MLAKQEQFFKYLLGLHCAQLFEKVDRKCHPDLGVKFVWQNYWKHQKRTNPLFYSDCNDFFILDFIFGMSTKLPKKNSLPPPYAQQKKSDQQCGLIVYFLDTNTVGPQLVH